MKKFVSMWNMIKIRWESPIGIWKKFGKPYFKFPKLFFKLYIREKEDRKYFSPGIVLDIVGQDISYKSKYGVLEFEESPFIRITLFKRLVMQIDFVAPADNNLYDDICYWEGLLSMMANDTLMTRDNALLEAYNDNIWDDMEGARYTMEPYLTNLGWHVLQSKKSKSLSNIH